VASIPVQRVFITKNVSVSYAFCTNQKTDFIPDPEIGYCQANKKKEMKL